ncbi:hypothetical protein QQG74_09260 [Micromonospora sp. FIMYZ51]|uniref:hypothetical protein n=1 Tax=Micromonospora sp. FIMYZ51 TaxID=3051832 RepID=UPI00311FA54A
MSPNLNSRSAPLSGDIHRIRTRRHANGSVAAHTTYSDGRKVCVPANVEYQSRVGWRTDGRVLWTEPVR